MAVCMWSGGVLVVYGGVADLFSADIQLEGGEGGVEMKIANKILQTLCPMQISSKEGCTKQSGGKKMRLLCYYESI